MGTPIPTNQAAFSLEQIRSITGAQGAVGAAASVQGVTTDSRGDIQGKLFVALRGDQFDGHKFVPQAIAAGAAAVLVEDEPLGPSPVPVLSVASCLDALGALAGEHRHRWNGQVVAVGGSAGKTTTRAAITALLNQILPGVVHTSVGNLNNRIGVPMVLLGLRPEHRIAVVEIGTNQTGEVEQLARVVQPDIAVLTLVALEHSAGLGGLDEIEAEEGALLHHTRRVAIANGDDKRARRQLRASAVGVKFTYGLAADCDYRCLERRWVSLTEAQISLQRPNSPTPVTFSTSLLGMPGALAATAAVCVADAVLGHPVATGAVQSALAQQGVGEAGRLRPFELSDGTLLLDDSYNANPASMIAAIAVAGEVAHARGARLLLVLGEMRELGAVSPSEHRALAANVAPSGAVGLVAVAGDAQELAAAAQRQGVPALFVPKAELALAACKQFLQAGDVVLFKASHSIGLERLVAELVREKGLAT